MVTEPPRVFATSNVGVPGHRRQQQTGRKIQSSSRTNGVGQSRILIGAIACASLPAIGAAETFTIDPDAPFRASRCAHGTVDLAASSIKRRAP
jgi:hypothetical protein